MDEPIKRHALIRLSLTSSRIVFELSVFVNGSVGIGRGSLEKEGGGERCVI